MRRYIIAGNWKMNVPGIEEFEAALRLPDSRGVSAVICPPFPFIASAAQGLSGVMIGAQDVSAHGDGAYTGEVSAAQLRRAGARYVIVGHSERRSYHGESDELVGKKARAALREELTPIICVGETLSERESGKADSVTERQLRGAFAGMGRTDALRCIIAYEPVWAIGTGVSASASDAQSACGAIRGVLTAMYGEDARQIPILYGGSMSPANAEELLRQPDIDGGLIGGASLDAGSFSRLLDIAAGLAAEV